MGAISFSCQNHMIPPLVPRRSFVAYPRRERGGFLPARIHPQAAKKLLDGGTHTLQSSGHAKTLQTLGKMRKRPLI